MAVEDGVVAQVDAIAPVFEDEAIAVKNQEDRHQRTCWRHHLGRENPEQRVLRAPRPHPNGGRDDDHKQKEKSQPGIGDHPALRIEYEARNCARSQHNAKPCDAIQFARMLCPRCKSHRPCGRHSEDEAKQCRQSGNDDRVDEVSKIVRTALHLGKIFHRPRRDKQGLRQGIGVRLRFEGRYGSPQDWKEHQDANGPCEETDKTRPSWSCFHCHDLVFQILSDKTYEED